MSIITVPKDWEEFNHLDTCWKDNTAGHNQSRRFWECISENFLTQRIEEPRRRGALLDLVLTNKGLIKPLKVKGSFGCSNGGVQDPEKNEEGKKQALNPGI